MADILTRNYGRNSGPAAARPRAQEAVRRSAQPDGSAADWELIELLFFAYRDFVGDADAHLADYGFGRAHHRVLHFVNRHPGLKVADLLGILGITKQSLGRVLRELVEGGFVTAHEGRADRRQRLLFATAAGERLALELARRQTRRIASALSDAGPDGREAAVRFLFAMVDAGDRSVVDALIRRPASDPGLEG